MVLVVSKESCAGFESPQAATCGTLIAEECLLHDGLIDCAEQLAHQERLPLHLVHANRVDEERRSKQQPKLARVQFRNQHASVSRQNRSQVLRERIEIT